MYCSIEMNSLRVLHCNYTMTVVDALARIEALPKPYDVLVENTENRSFLHGLTTLELQTLYKNLTGADLDASMGSFAMRSSIALVINKLPVREAYNDELHSQLEYVWDNPGPTYRYVLGSHVPAIPSEGLWPYKGQNLTKEEFDAAEAAASRLTAKPARVMPTGTETERSPSAARPVSAPTGGARPLIWAHADKQWEAAGKPTRKDEVLVLRKQWMVELEGQGIKKSTSSTALGDWMKARIPAA